MLTRDPSGVTTPREFRQAYDVRFATEGLSALHHRVTLLPATSSVLLSTSMSISTAK